MDTIVKPCLSPSSIDTYLKCGEMWRRRYVLGERIPPGIAILKGKSVHGAAEANFKQKIESHKDLKLSDLKEAAAASFDRSVAEGIELTPEEKEKGKETVLGEVKDRSIILTGLFAEKVAPLYQPVLVEEKLVIEMPNSPFDLLGYIDLADNKDVISDLKTTGKSKTQDEADQSNQLTYYAAAYQVKTGRKPSKLRLDVLVDKKAPEHQQIETGRDFPDFERLAAKVEMVAKGIKAEVFLPPPPGSWACSPKFCGYWSTCKIRNGR
jgi:RecB family exonuclease